MYVTYRVYANTINILVFEKAILDALDKEIVIMHPGPINRGVEIDSDVADSEHSIILDQVGKWCGDLNGHSISISRSLAVAVPLGFLICP